MGQGKFQTLSARYYTGPDTFRQEMESFYFRDWIYAGREESIAAPGDYFLCEFAGESLIVVRSQSGALRAFYNVCRHRGTRLCTEGAGQFGGRVQCPYHGWTYDFDGRLLGAPHMEEADFAREDYGLHTVSTATWDGHLFLNLRANPPPLSDQLGDLPRKFAAWRMQDLRLHRRIDYKVKANWKLVVLNYNECLHCPHLHPALHQLTDYMGADNEAPRPGYIGGSMGFRSGVETMSIDGRRRRDFLPGLDEIQRRQVYYYAIYPNLLLSLHPDYMMVHTLWPQSVDRTRIVCEWFFHPAEIAKPGFCADDAIAFWDTTNREDWAVVELSQAGIGSRAYTPGPYAGCESLLHAFDSEVLKREASFSTPARIVPNFT
ncbi:MAG: (2Fe-2S)-binding protein [Terriglobia bacterium]|nr:MAG: (2Fe-2S)-binding protein [Terriglobia bacterium]